MVSFPALEADHATVAVSGVDGPGIPIETSTAFSHVDAPLFGGDDFDLQPEQLDDGFSVSGDNLVFPDEWSPFDTAATGHVAPGAERSEPAVSSSFVGAGSFGDFPTSDLVSDQPVVSAAVHDAQFARCLFSNCDVSGISLPWETGIFRELLSEDDSVDSLVPKVPISSFCNFNLEDDPVNVAETIASVAIHDTSNPVFSRCISSADDGHYVTARRQLRDAAIGKLLIVVRHCLLASSTGRHIINLGTDQQQQDGAFGILDAVLGVRSPATIVKRANSLLSFLRWVAKQGIDLVNPFVESTVWDYLQHLKAVDATATKADSSMSAFRFAYHILGFESLASVLNSHRLVGVTEIMLSKKRLLRQALILTVNQIKGLHRMLVDVQMHPMDRALIGYMLFCLYGRCRSSDLLCIHRVELDFSERGGFIIISTANHKSGRMASLKTKLLPIIIPARGIDGSIWARPALDAMEYVGCCFDGPLDGPFMHAPSSVDGGFMERGLRSSEISSMLRSFLCLPEPAPGDEAEIVSSHSLKATLLAWGARFGLSPQTRSMLGRHTSCLTETFAIYSRDLACAPVAELQTMIDAIVEGSFSPDEPRSGFFKPAAGSDTPPLETGVKTEQFERPGTEPEVLSPQSPAEGASERVERIEIGALATDGHDVAKPAEPGQIPVENQSDSDSSSTGSDVMTSDDSEVPDPPARVKRFRVRIPKEESWYVHTKSHLIHRFDGNVHNMVRFLVCGKRLNEGYTLCTEATAWNTLCRSCNKR